MTKRERIDDFLGQKRLALVGVSHKPKDFTRLLLSEFMRRGYDVVAVNPSAIEIDGVPCFPRIQDVSPPVDGVLLLTPAAVSETIASECVEAGVRRVWFYRALGEGAVSRKAAEYCEARGVQVIAGGCPFMFWKGSGWIHRVHAALAKITGTYPR
ncbi:MAG: CoA-binding protein [Acidobacteriales bacterium]|nr:CoA-binding protein [Terriglobales bacterium]